MTPCILSSRAVDKPPLLATSSLRLFSFDRDDRRGSGRGRLTWPRTIFNPFGGNVVMKAGTETFEFEFRGADKAHYAHNLILTHIL